MQRVAISKIWFHWKSNFGPRQPMASENLFYGNPVGYVHASRDFSSANSLAQH